MTSSKQLLAALFASLMMVSMVGAAAAPAAAQTSGPEGMVALGSAQVSEDLPAGSDAPIRADDLDGNVYASDHADTLEVIVTTPERADKYLENGSVVSDDEDVAIVLRDQEVHEGRDVAVDVDVLEAGVGYQPEVAYGTHSSGEEWQSKISTEGTNAIWNVPHFSSNTVTFSGGIELNGDAAGDGTSYEYELDSLDGVEDYSINVTGVENTAPGSASKTFANGESQSIDVGGNQPPRDETVTLTGKSKTNDRTVSGTDSSGSTSESISVGGTEPLSNSEVKLNVDSSAGSRTWEDTQGFYLVDDKEKRQESFVVDSSPDIIREFSTYIYSSDDVSHTTEVYLANGDTNAVENGEMVGTISGDLTRGEHEQFTLTNLNFQTTGETVSVGFKEVSGVSGYELKIGFNYYMYYGPHHIELSQNTADVTVSDESGSSTYTVSTSSSETHPIDISQSTSSVDFSGSNYDSLNYEISWTEESITRDPSVTIGGSTVSHSGTLSEGETVTESVSLSSGSNSLDVSTGAHTVDVGASWTEVSKTRDPVVEVNGYETSHDGTLANGDTVSLATNTAWLQNGTNTVTISTGSPATGPESLVGFDYAHDAAGTTRSVDVEATSWTETFNVSNTYPSETKDATATLTFVDKVAEIDSIEYRVDGGEWTSPPSYELNGTDLKVGFGDVAADTTIDVRATGYKVKTYDGDVEILEPTVKGDELATEVKLSNLRDDTMWGIRVDGTAVGDRVHYATDASWSGDPAHVDITSSGTQILRAPDANNGSTMTVRSSPISVEPESGAVEVVVQDAEEPRFKIRQGDTTGSETVEVTYHPALDGERYVLWSETQDREIDAARANSPVTFTTDDSAETYTVRQVDREGSVRTPPPIENGASTAPLVLVLPAVGLSVTGLFWAGRRFGGATGLQGNALLLVGSTIVSAAALELVTPTSLLAQIYRATVFALGDAVAGGLGAVVAAIATLVGLWQLQRRTRADVPMWVTIPSVTVVSILALESIRPGSVLGALEGVIAEVGALLALILVGFAIYWWRRRNRVQQTEAATPDTQVTLDLENQDQNGEN